MEELLQSYLPIVVFIGVALAIGLALLVAPFMVAYKQPDSEKLSLTNAVSPRLTTPA
jgi:NADH-quinone oxidoreductase subunit A